MNAPASIASVPLDLLGGHGYRIDGKVYPSVTTVLGSCGLGPDLSMIPAETLAAAAERGRFVHEYAALALGGSSAPACFEFPEEWAGYLAAFNTARQTLHLEPKVTEHILASARLRLAGRVDFVGRCDGRMFVVDFKTGPPDAAHGLQTAAYWSILIDDKQPGWSDAILRACLYLKADGRWTFVEHDGWSDYSIAQAAAVVANARLDRVRRT